MMRKILFRGKCYDVGAWIFGSLLDDDIIITKGAVEVDDDYINIVDEWSSVLPETVGQYTGLKDSTGKRIFEGDILEFEDLGEEGYEYKEGFDFINTASVVFNNGRFELENFGSDNSGVLEEMNDDHEDFISIFTYSKIIGNIHDNPELLEVQG
ncbi:YopX family protein [Acetobacterium wieringae]|uniref:YopX family protein n=1 Tax=Acetobacterium wieringae TaxID=52694 RepID=UPI002033F201|nr:YopX family protein [Acetobacterium wieringae]URN85847.1 YopX family protein [Acetobacterium wieringae]